MELLIVFVLLWLGWFFYKAHKETKLEEKIEVNRLVLDFLEPMVKTEETDSFKIKTRYFKKAVRALYQLKDYKNHPMVKEHIIDYDEALKNINALSKVTPLLLYIEKAERAEYKGNKRSEKSYLLDFMYDVEKDEITGQDIKNSGLDISISEIKNRIQELS